MSSIKWNPPPPQPSGEGQSSKLDLPIRKIIVVGSGKGGVGKSTVAFNLAYALAKSGQKVGLLDADIYGPSVPKLTGLSGQKPQTDETQKLVPLEAHGLKVMSIGFLVEEDKALIWRGPMIHKALFQMLRDVAWGTDTAPLDILVIDLPPGTGDVQLTLAQKLRLEGAVVVSTPQDLALADARRAVEMFRKTDVPILGLIENMSTHICTNCGHEDPIFGHGGAQDEASKLNVPFLGEIPLSAAIREQSDRGKPVPTERFQDIADRLSSSLELQD